MWIGIRILLPHWFHKIISLRKYILGDSWPFRPGCDLHYYYYYFFFQVCYGWPQKHDFHQFSHFFLNFWQQWSKSSGHVGRCRFFWNLQDKFIDEKKITNLSFILGSTIKMTKSKNYFSPDFVEMPQGMATFLGRQFFFNVLPKFFFHQLIKKSHIAHAPLHAHEYILFNWNWEKSIVCCTEGNEESERFSPSVKFYKITLFSRFQLKRPYSYAWNGTCEIYYISSIIDAQLD